MTARLALLAALALLAPGARAQEARPRAPEAARQGGPAPLEALDIMAARLVEAVAPSVVQITVERAAAQVRPLTQAERAGLGVTGNYDPRYFARPESTSSGVVVAPGIVATATWNLEGAGDVTVISASGARHPARRLGRDENLDVALLALDDPEGKALPALPRATRPAAVAQFLLLVGRTDEGSPLVTRGIVSGLQRYRGDAFAHSARTSYQNLGGALVDLDGRLVGISVRHSDRSRQGQSSGVGFGALVSDLEAVSQRLIAGEVVQRRQTPFLGISADPAPSDGSGVRIAQIVANTAAAKAGIRAGDKIKIFNQVELRDFAHLRDEIEKLSVGVEIVITIVRGAEELDIRVTLGARPRGEEE